MPASAGPVVGLRIGDHPGFGRLVFDLPEGVRSEFSQEGDRVTIRFAGGAFLATERPAPRNLQSVIGLGDGVALQLSPGSTVREQLMDRRLVIDVFDASVAGTDAPRPQTRSQPPSQPPAHPQVRTPEPRTSPPARTVPTPASLQAPAPLSKLTTVAAPPKVQQLAEVPTARARETAPPAPMLAPSLPVIAEPPIAAQSRSEAPTNVTPTPAPPPAETPSPLSEPVPPTPSALPRQQNEPGALALSASIKVPVNGAPGHMIVMPFAATVGAAAFRRGRNAVVVFDERKPIDLAAARGDPVFANAAIQLLPGATVLSLTLPPQTELRLEHQAAGWSVIAVGGNVTPPPLQPIRLEADGRRLRLPAANPGLVVSIRDANTGGVLLIGTQRQPGQGVSAARRGPDFTLLPTYQGVVVEPLSDRVLLKSSSNGFVVFASGDGDGLVATMPDPAMVVAENASRMSRSFDLPNLRTDGLLRRLQGSVAVSATAPAQGKAAPRRQVAEAMLALGLAAEAQGVLALATEGDARSQDDPQQAGLGAIAAILTGRSDQAGALDDPRLSGTDEIELWRAIRTAMRTEGSPTAAQSLANLLPLLLDYPQPLRDRLLPLVAETLALGGQADAADRLLDGLPVTPDYDLARAFLKQARTGDPAEALAQFDRLAQSPNRLTRVRAAQRAAELRLSSGLAGPKETAAALSKLLYAWRGDDREIDLRMRIADLQSAAGEARPALKLLRESEETFPDHKAAIRDRLATIFRTALSPEREAAMPAFDLVTMAEENADLIPSGDAGQDMAERLCDRLVELDLPARAIPLLERLTTSTPAGLSKSVFGGRLAAVRLQTGDPEGAIAALTASVADSLPQPLLESRTLTFAAAVAAQGDMVSADRAIAALDSLAGYRLQARLKEEAKDWHGAVSAWQAVVARVLPEQGLLSEEQAASLVRLASAAAQAGDDQLLSQLRQTQSGRLPPGPNADLFTLLTAQPVNAVTDLATVSRDVSLAKRAPTAIAQAKPATMR